MSDVRFSVRSLAIGFAMVMAAGAALALRPTVKLADEQRFDLEAAIPKQFGAWKIDPSVVPISVSPDVQAKLDKIYNQTLARTYVNAAGQRVMLSIAYGGDQSSEQSQVHRPEYCYASQGFQLRGSQVARLVTEYGQISVRRLLAVQGNRKEPITYWITVGDQATLPGFGRKLTQIAYGLTGKVPDGMLVRVSSIAADTAQAYEIQDAFLNDMLHATSPQARLKLAGRFGA